MRQALVPPVTGDAGPFTFFEAEQRPLLSMVFSPRLVQPGIKTASGTHDNRLMVSPEGRGVSGE